jgi:protein ImuA
MQLISCHNGRLLTSALAEQNLPQAKVFTTGLSALDELLPHGGFVRGAIHEILAEKKHGTPRFFALLLAARGTGFQPVRENQHGLKTHATKAGAIVWSEPRHELYPPAIAGLGIPLDRLYLLHPQSTADQIWAITECLRCRGIAATIAQIDRLSRIEARRLQLAAETGGGIGILLRPLDRAASIYAAATRWLVAPMPGERTVQRWKIQLFHAHGGRIGSRPAGIILEHHRENSTIKAHSLHPAAQLADRPVATRASA